MGFLIPLFYVVMLSFWLTHIRWIRQAGFGKRFVLLFFIAKCGAGFAYSFIALHLPHRGDIWPFFDDGVEMYRLFLQSPQAFFQTYGYIFHYSDFNATDTHSDFVKTAFEVIRLLHFGLSFLTGGNLWGNTVIFNFGATLCFLYCWRFLKKQSPQGLFVGPFFFLLPSMFFYSAGILKEGIVISLLCLLIPLSSELLNGFSVKRLMIWLPLFALLAIVKIFVAGLWLAAVLLWAVLRFFPTRQRTVLILTIAVAFPMFFYTSRILPSVDLPGYVQKRQQEFLNLPAGSAVYIQPLTKQPSSYGEALPVALNNVLFKPLPGEGGKALYSLYAVEMILFWLGIAFIIWKREKGLVPAAQKTLAIVFLVFALFNLLFIGFIIPNIGSIIRYRSIFMPFVAVAVALLCRPVFIQEKWNGVLEKWIQSSHS